MVIADAAASCALSRQRLSVHKQAGGTGGGRIAAAEGGRGVEAWRLLEVFMVLCGADHRRNGAPAFCGAGPRSVPRWS